MTNETANETVSASLTIEASADAVFSVLTDPAKHAAIDGTGWVRDPLDPDILTASGQIFGMAMYAAGHPNGNYEMTNRVDAFDPPHVISWEPGYYSRSGKLHFGGWIWRYDLDSIGPSETKVTLTYDWSAVSEQVRSTGPNFPPFGPDHLDNSLAHLAELVGP